MKPKHLFIIIICHFSFYNYSFSQDAHFTQSFGAMTYNNPAFTGNDTIGTVFITHRNQWPKLVGTYQTTIFGWSQYFSNNYMGFHYMFDHAGALMKQQFMINYARNIQINKLLIRPAFEFGYFQKTIDWSQLSFGDQIDPRTGFVYNSGDQPRGGGVSNLDFNAGLLFNFYNVTFGLSVHHLTQPNESILNGFSPLPMKMGFQTSYSFIYKLNSHDLRLDPFFMYYSQGNFQLVQFGFNFSYDNYLIGISNRKNDALSFLAGYRHNRFTIAYSYDYTTSNLSNENTGGSHEFTIAARFWKRKSGKNFTETLSAFY